MASSKKLNIIGLGTGRCGTQTLAHLLNKQPGFSVSHEAVVSPWEPSDFYIQKIIFELNNRANPVVGDISFYYLNYCEQFIEQLFDVKFPIMKRRLEPTVKSYMAWTKGRNHWSKELGKGEKKDRIWDNCYPKYNLPKEDALRLYCVEYYKQCEDLIWKYPELFKIFDVETFNTQEGQDQLFEFIGVKEENRVYDIGIKSNVGRY
jgi:hypothetical protein